jgi:electron transfer flavoprotein alpha subunit
MTTLLLAEHDNASLKDATRKALTAAKALGAPVHVLVAGQGCQGRRRRRRQARRRREGAARRRRRLRPSLAEPLAALIVSLAGGYDAIVAPGTTTGKNVMPRVAALLDVMQVSEVTKVVSPDTFERPIYAGNAIQTVQSTDAKKVITVRTASFQATGEGGGSARSRPSRPPPIPACRALSARRSRSPTGPSSRPPRSSSRAAARSARRRISAR